MRDATIYGLSRNARVCEGRLPLNFPYGTVIQFYAVHEQPAVHEHFGTVSPVATTCVTLYIKGVVGATPSVKSATPT